MRYLKLLLFVGLMLGAQAADLPPETAPTPPPILTAFLPGNVVYWRLASFTPESGWAGLAAQLDQWNGQKAEGIILDLRSNAAPDDYAGAAQVASFFAPANAILFSMSEEGSTARHVYRSTQTKEAFRQPIVVVVNNQTGGAAEALAGCLKARGALIIGQTTEGKAAVIMPDGTALWGHPVIPDIGLTINGENEKEALALIAQHGVLDVIREAAERRRLSEASLVQGDNPELDDYLASREKKTGALAAGKPAVQDIALIDALDSLKAIRLSQRWTASSAGVGLPPESSTSVQ